MEKIINKGYLSAVSSGWCCLGTITSYDGDSWTEYLGRISLQEMFDVIRNARGSLARAKGSSRKSSLASIPSVWKTRDHFSP
jgi:hypothetical protein